MIIRRIFSSFLGGVRHHLALQWRRSLDEFFRAYAPAVFQKRLVERLTIWLFAHPNFGCTPCKPAQSADYHSLVRWENWPSLNDGGSISAYNWWSWSERGYQMTYLPTDIKPICTSKVISIWSGDIVEIDGLSASKSPLDKYKDLDIFAEKHCSSLIFPTSSDQLELCLKHTGVKITPNNGAEFITAEWDNRLFLINYDGSHHFSAARYIAKKLGTPVQIGGNLNIIEFNRDEVDNLLNTYIFFAINELLIDDWRLIAMDLKLSFGLMPPPRPMSNFKILVIHRNDASASAVAVSFGRQGVFDFGAFIKEQASARLIKAERSCPTPDRDGRYHRSRLPRPIEAA